MSMANDIIVCLNSISPQISKHSSYMRIKKETIHKRHTIFRAKAEHEAYNNHQIKSRARGIQYSDFQSTQAKGCALHTILKIITERLGTERRQGTYQADGRRRQESRCGQRRLQLRQVNGEGRAGPDVQEL